MRFYRSDDMFYETGVEGGGGGGEGEGKGKGVGVIFCGGEGGGVVNRFEI